MQVKLVNENFRFNYVDNLLHARGIENIKEYLAPTPSALQDPADLENIEAGAQLYMNHIGLNHKILIVVDSDNDGFTSAAIIYQYTKLVAPETEIDYWLHEGKQHGLQDHIDRLMTENVKYDLIILPDSSSNDAHYHDMLADIHIPCLILDHHLTDIPISSNAVVINNQMSPKYKNKELTGAGVVYQFCRYIDRKAHFSCAKQFLDLAAWGIIGDMGSVLELENRYIIKEGLSHITNKFLIALMEKQAYSITGDSAPSDATLRTAMNPISVAFYIVPLVNAMIRVGTMEEKRRLFLAFIDGDRLVPSGKRGAKGTLEKVSIESARECTNARNRQNRIKDNAVASLEAKIYKYDLLDNRILFVRLEDDDQFPPELNGLIAMQLSARFQRPTIVARLNPEGYIRGSGRGLNDSQLNDFKKFLTDSNYFEYAQGHPNAFGCSIRDADLRKFHEWANKALADIDFGESVYSVNFDRYAVDYDLQLLIADIAHYDGIWGQGNPTPLIYVHNISVYPDEFTIMGKNLDTVKVEKNGIAYIKFHAKDLIDQLQQYQIKYGYKEMQLEIVGEANLNNWMGNISPQIFIQDYDMKPTSIVDF